jgi:REP element-mobilizing transposase RayT
VTTPRRFERADELVHVISHGVFGDRLAPNEAWASELFNELGSEAKTRGWRVWSLVIMGTHYHLLVETPDRSLSAGLQRVHSAHAIRRNHHHERRKGAVFGRRPDIFDIRDARHLRNTLRYIPQNPVKARLCNEPANWSFGTYRALAGLEPCPSWVPKASVFRFLEGVFADPHDLQFNEDRYRAFCSPTLVSPVPPLARDDWNRYDAACMREDGKSTRDIAEALGITIRHANRLRGLSDAAEWT